MKWMLVIAAVLAPATAQAGLRYALVVGNNHGNTADVVLEDLTHAEREATALHRRLLQFGSFTDERTFLLRGATRAEILAAAEKLAAQRERDQRELGDVPTLFAFFFTGHGLAGELLTPEQPIGGTDLAHIFKRMDASLSLGFFDACHSGSLDLDALKAKGVVVTPGFNPITELPQEVLNSEGTMWFVSSQPGELSYEDRQLGGLVTHFFIEAFVAAPRDGVGISLETMWEYARQRTIEHVSRHQRKQTPGKIVSRLTQRAPVVFSFPEERNAELTLGREVEGTFLLSYEGAALVEKVVKARGQPLHVPMYSGDVRLSIVMPGEQSPTIEIVLPPGARMHLRSEQIPGPDSLGVEETPIVGKGDLPALVLTAEQASLDWLVGLDAGWRHLPEGVAGARYLAYVSPQVAYGAWGIGLGLGFGFAAQEFDAWSYQSRSYALRLVLSRSILELGPVHAALEALGGVSLIQWNRDPGGDESAYGFEAAGAVTVGAQIPLGDIDPVVKVRVLWGFRDLVGARAGEVERQRSLGPGAQLGIALPL